MPSLTRRSLLRTLAASAFASGLEVRPAAGEPTQASPGAPVMDAMGELRMEYEVSLIRDMLASGLRSITITLCDPKPVGDEALALAIDSLLQHDRYLARNPEFFVKATSVADLERARRDGKMAVFYLYQNTAQFGRELDRVDLFHRLGLRSCQLTYNDRNLAGTGCGEEGGLTPFGRELIGRMNERRMLLDLSHAKKADNLHAYFDHLLHAIRVAGMEHVCIGSDRDHRVIRLSPEYLAELKREEGSQVVDDDLPYFIDELNGPRRMEVVRDGLAQRGLSTGDVEKVMGGNLLRLYRDVMG
jgi:microsomal dipeptidase-like Zn-dependent dipeptidase